MENELNLFGFLVCLFIFSSFASHGQDYLPSSTTDKVVKHLDINLRSQQVVHLIEDVWQQLKLEQDVKGRLKREVSTVGSISNQ